jgi:hypothetical protein
MSIQSPLPLSIPAEILAGQEICLRFRRALRRHDQLALDELLNAAYPHLPAAAQAVQALPFEVLLLAVILEQHKEIQRLSARLERCE